MALSTESEQVLRFDHPSFSPLRVSSDQTSKTVRWLRGDLLAGKSPAILVPANTGSGVFIEPGTNSEEWDVVYISAFDDNHIDILDTFFCYWNYVPLNIKLDIQTQQFSTSQPSAPGFVSVFPSRDVSNPKNSVGIRVPDLTVRRLNPQTVEWQIVAQIATSATVGNRSFHVSWAYRRRRVE